MKQYTEKENQERKMFGETIEEMRAMAGEFRLKDPLLMTMYAMGILSDAQHVLAMGTEMNGIKPEEMARMWMNKAKYFMSEVNRELHPATKMERARREAAEFNARREAAKEERFAKLREEAADVLAQNTALNAELKRRQEERNADTN